MYQYYFENQGWSTRITDAQRDFNVNKGYKFFAVNNQKHGYASLGQSYRKYGVSVRLRLP